MPKNKDNNTSPHILSASSNLVGFSFVSLTTVHTLGLPGATIIDAIAAVEILLFSVSSLFSFISMHTVSERRSDLYENIADYIFFLGLIILSFSAIVLVLALIK